MAIGYTPLTDSSKFYNIWYYVALKARAFDTIGEICFAAVTSLDLAAELGIQRVPNARLILWNTTRVSSVLFPIKTWMMSKRLYKVVCPAVHYQFNT